MHILMWIMKNDKEVRWPLKLNPEKVIKRDKTKYCHFHEDHRHTMEELIRDNTLQKFAKKSREEKRSEHEELWAKQEVRFGPVDKAIGFFQNDPLVTSVRLNMYEVRRVLVDTCSSVNLLTLDVFNKVGLDRNNLVKVSYPLVGLGDKIAAVLGTINLPLVLVDIPLAYNVILGRTVLNCHDIVINMGAMCLKVPALGGLMIIQGNQM
ncbi:hypothetical protein MANES_11G076151v8 [Manihot esculenta]|uniref:Uncharacterized protein n=1 Tax=Manihot esculenta TaxID=3983 RepID=A0ACB7GVT2_MANES|nr:hypothetical protein MANES_11G076151v8 [Manihot esculenta]